jgi:hypothetical protein
MKSKAKLQDRMHSNQSTIGYAYVPPHLVQTSFDPSPGTDKTSD